MKGAACPLNHRRLASFWRSPSPIKSFFDSIDHHLLEQLLEKHFCERRLFNLYWMLVKAGYVEWSQDKKKKYITADMGVPQGGIVSPLLSNLVLHELDVYMQQLNQRGDLLSQGEPAYRRSPTYNRAQYLVTKYKKEKNREQLKKAIKLRRRTLRPS